jgi:DNA polymerase-3 subunit delta'
MTPEQLLDSALDSGRLPHALLFSGPAGTGKRETARRLALSLLCDTRKRRGCGSCRSCTKVSRGSHPDLLWIEPDGQFIKIEQVRGLIRSLGFRPLEASARLAVLIEADRLMDAAANALLKTLEEPPGHTTLVLISSKPEALLPTIRSRIQRLSFRPLGDAAVEQALRDQDGVDPDEARLRARRAAGSLEAARGLDYPELRAAHDQALELLEAACTGDFRSTQAGLLLEACKELSRSAEQTTAFLSALRIALRDAAVVALTGSRDRALDRQSGERVARLARRLGAEQAMGALERIEQAEQDFLHNANRRLVLESLLLGIWRRAEQRGH